MVAGGDGEVFGAALWMEGWQWVCADGMGEVRSRAVRQFAVSRFGIVPIWLGIFCFEGHQIKHAVCCNAELNSNGLVSAMEIRAATSTF